MRSLDVVAIGCALALVSCHSTPPARTAPTGATAGAGGAERPSTAEPAGGRAAGGGAAGPAPLRVRRPPDPRVQDSIRRANVEQIAQTIVGRENEPAGRVFKNVKLLKDMPAGELLRNMNENYARGLGWVCTNCHVAGQFDSDTKKNKRIARQMQEQVNYINHESLPTMKELDADYKQVSCVTCHRGSNQIQNTMAVPEANKP